MKRYRLKLILPGKAGAILRLLPNAMTFVAYLGEMEATRIELAGFALAQFGIDVQLEEAK